MPDPTQLDVTATTDESGAGGSTGKNVAYTPPSGGSNRVGVVILIGRWPGTTVTVPTWDGVSMTRRDSNTYDDLGIRVYTIANPGTSAINIVPAFSASVRWGIFVATLQDCNQSTPVRLIVGDLATLSSGALSPIVVGDWIYAACGKREITDVLSGPGGTTQRGAWTTAAADTTAAINNRVVSLVATGTSHTFTFTSTPDNGDVTNTIAIAFQAPAGGVSATPEQKVVLSSFEDEPYFIDPNYSPALFAPSPGILVRYLRSKQVRAIRVDDPNTGDDWLFSTGLIRGDVGSDFTPSVTNIIRNRTISIGFGSG